MPTASKAFHAMVHSLKAYPAVLNSSEDSNTRLRIPNLQNIPIIFMIMLIVQSPNCKDTQNVRERERERERERRLGTCEVLTPKDVVRPAIPAPTITMSSSTSMIL